MAGTIPAMTKRMGRSSSPSVSHYNGDHPACVQGPGRGGLRFSALHAGGAPPGPGLMPIAIIPFPELDPVLVTIGPFAIRWYALSYICGILLGWVYARAMIRNEHNWGGPAPLTVLDFDDFV